MSSAAEHVLASGGRLQLLHHLELDVLEVADAATEVGDLVEQGVELLGIGDRAVVHPALVALLALAHRHEVGLGLVDVQLQVADAGAGAHQVLAELGPDGPCRCDGGMLRQRATAVLELGDGCVLCLQVEQAELGRSGSLHLGPPEVVDTDSSGCPHAGVGAGASAGTTIAAMTEESTQPETAALPNRAIPFSEAFREFIPTDWAPYPTELPARAAPPPAPAAVRRRALAEAHPGERLVIPAGGFKVRANDTDYRFRPHSAFAWLTGLGSDREPDSVLVLEPTDTGHEATLYFKPRAPRTDPEFYADSRYGEMWVGTRESLAEMTALTGISCAPISELDAALGKNVSATTVRLLAEADEVITRRIGELRAEAGVDLAAATEGDAAFLVALSEARLVKDDFELDQLRQACNDTAVGFEAVVADLPEAVRRGRGERWVEGVFGLHARHQANAVGYDTIAAVRRPRQHAALDPQRRRRRGPATCC